MLGLFKDLNGSLRSSVQEQALSDLSEHTAAQGGHFSQRIRDALQNLVEHRTSLVIAHRLSTIQRADRIFVMHKGKLRESGTHQELLAGRGIYYKLYQLQYKDQEIPVGGSRVQPV